MLKDSHIEYYSKPKHPKDYETPNKKDLKGTIELKDAQAGECTSIKASRLSEPHFSQRERERESRERRERAERDLERVCVCV